ncbi:MAG: enoyl-CoA hydratase-related protein [Pseudonocardia sp.]|nr:enoyl-CoA hydratase-related protein [Pseudonocardia sp.]
MTSTVLDGGVLDGRVLRCRVAAGKAGTLDSEAMVAVARVLRGLATPEQAAGKGVGAVLLAHDGASFCAGGDVRAFESAPDRGAYVKELADTFHEFLEAYVRCAVPTVAGVQGWAAGAGMSVVLATDIVVVGHSTKLRPAYPGIGFSPDGGMSWTLPRIVGAGRARQILLTDQILGADALVDTGIAATVVEDAELAAEAERTAHRLAQGPTAALGRIKRLLADSWSADLRTHLDAEAAAISASASGPEGAEGLAAFVGKRVPRFQQ